MTLATSRSIVFQRKRIFRRGIPIPLQFSKTQVPTEGFSSKKLEISRFQVSEVANLDAPTTFSDYFPSTCPAQNDDRVVSPVILMSSENFSAQCHSDSPSVSDDPHTGATAGGTVPQEHLDSTSAVFSDRTENLAS